MPVTTYTRFDTRIRLEDAAMPRLSIHRPGAAPIVMEVARTSVDEAARGNDGDFERKTASAFSSIQMAAFLDPQFERVTVEVDRRAWAAIPFESYVAVPMPVVRLSPTVARVAQTSMTFPIRILETGSPLVVEKAIEGTFYGAYRNHAFANAASTLSSASDDARRFGWATVEILHVHDLVAGEAMFSTARTETAGTLGWLMRFADRFQTRLIVIDARPSQRATLRRFAQAIIERGGPCVWLIDSRTEPAFALYAGIAHDRPLDWIRRYVAGELFICAGAEETLRYSGIGTTLGNGIVANTIVTSMRARTTPRPKVTAPRKTAVYDAITAASHRMRIPVSKGRIQQQYLWGTRGARLGDEISTRLLGRGYVVHNLDKYITLSSGAGTDIDVDQLVSHISLQAAPITKYGTVEAIDAVSGRLIRIGEVFPGLEFENHESDGMLPLAAKVREVRTLANMFFEAEAASTPGGSRDVQIDFYRADAPLLARVMAPLSPGDVALLGVRIAPAGAPSAAFGSVGFLEERVRWKEAGAWIDVGVTPLDFQVVGDPVQELWVPRQGASDIATFAVRPDDVRCGTIPGIARLRVTLYSGNNVIQSFIVAAIVEGFAGNRAAALARGVNADPETDETPIAVFPYAYRMEYATQSIENATTAPPRALSIVANDSAGDKVFTVKADDLFDSFKDPNIGDKVKAVRDALNDASEARGRYRYLYKEVNDGDPADLFETLWNVAEKGFDIFNLLARDRERQQQISAQLPDGACFHGAHIDASDVIPWSLIYDRPVIRQQHDYTTAVRVAVASGLCRASMPDEDGVLPKVTCGGPGCLLNQADNDARQARGEPVYRENTVICPRRFWGFRLRIEIPAQQVTAKKKDETDQQQGSTPREVATAIKATTPVSVVVPGFNPTMKLLNRHRTTLVDEVFNTNKTTPPTTRATFDAPKAEGRDALRQHLLTAHPDIVYFYCHATAAVTTPKPIAGPFLDFGSGAVADMLAPKDLVGDAWTHAPLVFINGCSTTGFSPYAPSEFIKEFIWGRHASAVIGTEVTVWEALAGEMGRLFLKHFLDGKTAGEALLLARRSLLARNNPLGLVYTLYGSADLTLTPSQATATSSRS